MDERQKLMLQIRAMRSGIDPKLLAQMQKVAVAFFGPALEGRGLPRPFAPPKAPPAKAPAMDGRSVALRALDARQRRANADGSFVLQGDVDGTLMGPDSGSNVQKTVELYLAELRRSRESAAELVKRVAGQQAAAKPVPAAPAKAPPAKPALSADEVEEKKRNFLKRWFVK